MNLAAVTGDLIADLVRRETTKGVTTTFRVASDYSPRIWIDAECWGRSAATVAAHLTARRHVAVTGSLAHSQRTGRHGTGSNDGFIRATQVTFLDRPDDRRHNGYENPLGRWPSGADLPEPS